MSGKITVNNKVNFGGKIITAGQPPVVTMQSFTTVGSSNFTIPMGVTSINLELWGTGGTGGAGGSGSSGANGHVSTVSNGSNLIVSAPPGNGGGGNLGGVFPGGGGAGAGSPATCTTGVGLGGGTVVTNTAGTAGPNGVHGQSTGIANNPDYTAGIPSTVDAYSQYGRGGLGGYGVNHNGAGGNGSDGSYIYVTGIAVTPGNVINIVIGATGGTTSFPSNGGPGAAGFLGAARLYYTTP